MMEKKKNPVIEIVVYDSDNNIISNAKVILIPLEKPHLKLHLAYDKSSKSYKTNETDFVKYNIKVNSDNFKQDEREIKIDPTKDFKDIFILGKDVQPFFYRGKVKVPFTPRNDLLAASMNSSIPTNQKNALIGHVSKFDLENVPVSKAIMDNNVMVFKIKSKDVAENVNKRLKIHEELSKNKTVEFVGPILRMDEKSLSFLTNQIVVQFKKDINDEEITTLIKKYNLDIVNNIQYAKNKTYLLSTRKEATYEMLEICEQMVQSGKVEYAEPDIFSTVEEDSINPTDLLYSQQWHLSIVNTSKAWSILNDINPNITFGSSNMIIAVMDSGIDSTHPDLNGTVTNGSQKIYQLFDFVNMVSDNNSLAGDHGTCCAGVSTGNTNNNSIVSGENEGIVGAAGNCRLMGLRRGGPETKYADAYMWAAGFDPNSTIPGFPTAINPGADIITNSFGFSVGMPISGLMNDTFDFLTDNGRNGKGTLLFFSAGNANTDFTLQRPWAAYERTFAIASSSLADDGSTEVRSTYSNFGGTGIIDVCAPSNDEFPTVHNPPLNYAVITTTITGSGNLIGHTGGGLDYKNNFGGTSSATPLSAGIGALVLSANPDLTWLEVKNILRDTAVKIDSTNIDSIGRWIDINGNPTSDISYEGPDYSRWYGFGRVDAEKAVQVARDKLSIKQIRVTISTGNINAASTDGKIFVGLGGREFRLDKPGNQFERGNTDTFIVGDGSNIENPNRNDLPTTNGTQDSPKITYYDVINFPKYIRFEPQNDGDNWNVDHVNVTTIPETKIFQGPNPEGNIWLGKISGLFLGLR